MEPPSSGRISVINESGRRLQTAQIRRAAAIALAGTQSDACILLTDDRAVRELNRRFHSVDEDTDVLSFPAASMEGAPLGDIAISVPYAERQAAARGVSLTVELQYLAIHGVLHLLGWDDEEETDRVRMQSEMARIGALAGLPPDEAWYSVSHTQESGAAR